MNRQNYTLLRRHAANIESRRLVDRLAGCCVCDEESMTRDYQRLVAELRTHVDDLAKEAWQGDQAARQWLLETFPGNKEMLRRSWLTQAGAKKMNHDKVVVR